MPLGGSPGQAGGYGFVAGGRPDLEQRAAGRPDDQALVHSAAEIAFPLLRERVLAATRAALGEQSCGVGAGPVGFHEALPADPGAAVRLIHNAQAWLLGAAGLPRDHRLVDLAFAAGLREASGILADVRGEDAAVQEWFFAVGRIALGDGR